MAAKRRKLPPGGELKEDYVFQWANDGKVGENVKFSELFGDKDTLLLPGHAQRGVRCPCQGAGRENQRADSDDMQWPVMHVFRKQGGKIVHFWATELSSNHEP